MMTYSYCKKIIQNKTYSSKEDMMDKLDVFLLNSRMTETEYNELTALLNQ
jgi:hypothetical protein